MKVWWLLFFSAPVFGWTLPKSELRGWKTNHLEVHVNPEGCSVSESTLYDWVDLALDAWNHIPTAEISISRSAVPSSTTVTDLLEGAATDTPLILCDSNFKKNHNGDPNLVPATTRVGEDSTLNYAGILLNTQSGAGDEISRLESNHPGIMSLALAHEVGHLLGLGHSGNANSLMYYSLNGKTEIRLSQDDKDGLSYLYPKDEFSHGAFGCASVHTGCSSAPAAINFLLTLFAGAFGFWLAHFPVFSRRRCRT